MRPEHVERFRREKFRALNANKSIVSGIEEVAKLYKLDKLFIVKNNTKRFDDEIYMYVWNEQTGLPVKEWDDVQDAIRYAIYTENKPYRRKG